MSVLFNSAVFLLQTSSAAAAAARRATGGMPMMSSVRMGMIVRGFAEVKGGKKEAGKKDGKEGKKGGGGGGSKAGKATAAAASRKVAGKRKMGERGRERD